MNDLISVIIPVYNVEPYLENCVRSVMRQTYSNIEILLVDDGSTDQSGAICDRLSAEDPRIRVFHKPNGGVSSARNIGAENCKGNYIAFVDSDDYVDSRYVEYLYGLIDRYQAEVSQCRSTSTNSWEATFTIDGETFYRSHDEIIEHGFNGIHIFSCLAILAKKELVLRYSFPENRTIGEDTLTTFKRLSDAKTIAVGEAALYAYYERPDSAVSATRNGYADPQLISCLKEAAQWAEERGAHGLSNWAWAQYTIWALQYTTTLDNSLGCFDSELDWVKTHKSIWNKLPVALRGKVRLYLSFPHGYIIVKTLLRKRMPN